jgi:hypothetical protein
MSPALSELLLTIAGAVTVSLVLVVLGDLIRGRRIRIDFRPTSTEAKQAAPKFRVLEATMMSLWAIFMLLSGIFEFHHKWPRRMSIVTSIGFLVFFLIFLGYSIRDYRRRKSNQISS